ncbi:hypothetical protein EVA_04114 [gut metagenome]|uniref:Uncharacterized protein n=1 Tax=gut metagenome TaxID=749906 RepID=J9H2K3_9ZZZZ
MKHTVKHSSPSSNNYWHQFAEFYAHRQVPASYFRRSARI